MATHIYSFYLTIFATALALLEFSSSYPTPGEIDDRDPRQLIHRNPDGSITASFAMSEAFDIPGAGNTAFDVAQTVNIGPQGATFGGGNSFSSNLLGNRVSFGQSNSQSSRFGPNGFSSSGANVASNSFSNPFFQSSNAQANAFANDFNSRGFGF